MTERTGSPEVNDGKRRLTDEQLVALNDYLKLQEHNLRTREVKNQRQSGIFAWGRRFTGTRSSYSDTIEGSKVGVEVFNGDVRRGLANRMTPQHELIINERGTRSKWKTVIDLETGEYSVRENRRETKKMPNEDNEAVLESVVNALPVLDNVHEMPEAIVVALAKIDAEYGSNELEKV